MSCERGAPSFGLGPLFQLPAHYGLVAVVDSRGTGFELLSMNRLLLVLGTLFLLSACAADAPSDSTVTRSDSAGVKIIVNSRADTTLSWTLTEIDVLRDSLGEPWLFEALAPARVLTDRAGRTYVLEDAEGVRRFGRDGRYERSFGRKGGGPGEMEFPLALMQQGDSLVVYDGGRSVLVRWGPELDPINDVAMRNAFEGVQQLAFRVGGVWVEKATFDSVGQTVALYGDTLPGAPLMQVQNGKPKRLSACGGQVGLMLPAFFSPGIHWETAGARMLANLGPAYDLRLYEGPRLLASVRRDLPLRKPTLEDLGRLYPEGMKLQAGPRIACTIPLEELQTQIGVAEMMPFVQDVALLSDGTMWVQRSLRNEPPVLDVFGSDGAYAGSLKGFGLPLGLLPNGELLVSREDPDSGGFQVVRLSVRK